LWEQSRVQSPRAGRTTVGVRHLQDRCRAVKLPYPGALARRRTIRRPPAGDGSARPRERTPGTPLWIARQDRPRARHRRRRAGGTARRRPGDVRHARPLDDARVGGVLGAASARVPDGGVRARARHRIPRRRVAGPSQRLDLRGHAGHGHRRRAHLLLRRRRVRGGRRRRRDRGSARRGAAVPDRHGLRPAALVRRDRLADLARGPGERVSLAVGRPDPRRTGAVLGGDARVRVPRVPAGGRTARRPSREAAGARRGRAADRPRLLGRRPIVVRRPAVGRHGLQARTGRGERLGARGQRGERRVRPGGHGTHERRRRRHPGGPARPPGLRDEHRP